MNERTDPTTIAYLAIGAARALAKQKPEAVEEVIDSFDGELGFFDRIISHAPMIDKLGYDAGDDLCGCFAYDVAEPFGERMANAMLNDELFGGAEAEALAKKLVDSITIKEPASPLEQAFQRYETALVENDAAEIAANVARNAHLQTQTECRGARQGLWRLMAKSETYVRNGRTFTANQSYTDAISVTKLATAQ